MHEEFKDLYFAALPLLRQTVLACQVGCKSGQGFYDYG